MAEFVATSAITQGLQGCPVCTSVGAAEKTHCSGCGAKLHAGWDESIQKTWAWLITSVMLYFPANFLPITYNRLLGRESESTILGGVVTLWEHGGDLPDWHPGRLRQDSDPCRHITWIVLLGLRAVHGVYDGGHVVPRQTPALGAGVGFKR